MAFAVILLVIAVAAIVIFAADDRRLQVYGMIALLPLILLMIPTLLPARPGSGIVTRIGIALSCILFAAGLVLTFQAVNSRRTRAAVLLAIETIVAALPAAIVAAYAILFAAL